MISKSKFNCPNRRPQKRYDGKKHTLMEKLNNEWMDLENCKKL